MTNRCEFKFASKQCVLPDGHADDGVRDKTDHELEEQQFDEQVENQGPEYPGAAEPQRPIQDFQCRVCKKDCDSAPPAPATAVCEEHCEDHDYQYSRDERGHFCIHCGKPAPEDWFDDI